MRLQATGAASAHHSFAMFDMEHPIEISGTVKEFKFVSPHTLLILQVKGEDGVVKDWTLEGGAPGLLVREGMTSKSLKPGDEITAKINPLHSGAEGGSYQPLLIKFKDGTPVVAPK
jgi:N-methylhydantoinase B/oxoprolinase/acetone carboxylase alpha subunit